MRTRYPYGVACSERDQWLYLVGQRFKLVTDNRAVQLIFSNSAMKPPARIERWALRLTQFDYEIVHRPSEANVADYFSRHPRKGLSSIAKLEESQVEKYVNLVVSCSMPRAVSKDELIKATRGDKELQELIFWVRREQSKLKHVPLSIKEYKSVLDEISVSSDGLVMRGQRQIIPSSLRDCILDLAHDAHQDMSKTKALIRSRVWFPNIDALVESRTAWRVKLTPIRRRSSR